MEMLRIVIEEKIPHGQISVAFTPDEECGLGAAYFDLDAFDADVAYTLDGDGEEKFSTRISMPVKQDFQ